MPKKHTSGNTETKKKGSAATSQAFGRGYDDAKKMKEAQEANFDRIFWLNIPGKEGEDTEQEVIFLHDEPLPIYSHGLTGNSENGKEFFQNFLCTKADGDCICCDMGAKRRQLSLFLVIQPGSGNSSADRVKILPVSSRALPSLERKARKGGIANCLVNITRNGKSAQTTSYEFERLEELDGKDYYDVEAVQKLLPEALAEIMQEIFEDNDENNDNFEDIYIEFLKRCLFADLEELEENPDRYELSRFDKQDSKGETESTFGSRRSSSRSGKSEEEPTRKKRRVVDYEDDEEDEKEKADEDGDDYVPDQKTRRGRR